MFSINGFINTQSEVLDLSAKKKTTNLKDSAVEEDDKQPDTQTFKTDDTTKLTKKEKKSGVNKKTVSKIKGSFLEMAEKLKNDSAEEKTTPEKTDKDSPLDIKAEENKNEETKAENVVEGEENVVEGEENVIEGEENVVEGEENVVEGEENVVEGEENVVEGEENVVEGEENVVEGEENVVDENEIEQNNIEENINEHPAIQAMEQHVENVMAHSNAGLEFSNIMLDVGQTAMSTSTQMYQDFSTASETSASNFNEYLMG
jgi:hypothetical protein